MKIAHFLDIETSFAFDLLEQTRAFSFADRLHRRLADFEQQLRIPRRSLRPNGPIMTKADLRQQSERIRQAPPRQRLYVKQTMGTTGRPVDIILDEETHYEFVHLSIPKVAAAKGIAVSDGPVYSLSIMGRIGSPDSVSTSPLDGRLCLRAKLDEREVGSLRRIQTLIERWHPRIIATKPVILEQILNRMDLHRWRAPDLIISSGDYLSPILRRKVESRLGAPIANAYAISEAGVVASECAVGNMHVDLTSAVVETIGDSGIHYTGRGQLLITSLVNRVMRIVRYETGDEATLASDPCACGRNGQIIHALAGRTVVNMRFPDGRYLDPSRLHYLLTVTFGVNEFRVTQDRLDRVIVEIETSEPIAGSSIARLHDALREQLDSLRVEVRQTSFEHGGPHQRYRSFIT